MSQDGSSAGGDELASPEMPQRVGHGLQRLGALLTRWFLYMFFLLFHVLVVLGACYLAVYWMARGRCYDSVEAVPARVHGLVLGCAPKVMGRDNLFFVARVKAATALYQAGKVQFLIVSGDNAREGYNEPVEMKAALVRAGVPAERIYCDYAGFRTLDSVVRAGKVFGLEEFVVISQRFHNERALYIARRQGLPDCVALDAESPDSVATWKMHGREVAARLMAVLDVEVFKTEPRFLGPRVPVGLATPPVDAPK